MRKLIILVTLLLTVSTYARQIKVAIIDSGINLAQVPDLKLCKDGLIDLTGSTMIDKIGHGTNVAGIISGRLKNVDYCAYVIKVYGDYIPYYDYLFEIPTYHLLAFALMYHIKDLDIINYSSGGVYSGAEEVLIRGLIYEGVIVDVPAGNNSQNLDIACNYWPACTKGTIVCGSLNQDKTLNKFSNYGKHVTVWEVGEKVCGGGLCMSGTSMATAVHTAKVVKWLYFKSLKEK